MAQHPQITIDLSFNDQVPNLVRDKFDLGLCYGEPPDGSYVTRYICSPQMIPVASPAYLAARGVPWRPADLADHQIISIRLRDDLDSTWTLEERTASPGSDGEPATFTPKSSLNILDNHDAAVEAALAGLGVALVLRQSAAPHLKKGSLAQVLPAYDVKLASGSKVFLLYPSKLYLPARARAFIDFLVELGRQHNWSNQAAAELRHAQPGALAAL
jgi:DNA-binding transcriptional LysR family regulator